MSYSDLVKKYLRHCIRKNNLPRTLKNKEKTLLRMRVTELSFDQVNGHLDKLSETWSPAGLKTETLYIRGFIAWAAENGVCEDFSKKLILPKLRRTSFTYIDPDKVVEIIEKGTEPGPGDNSRNREIKKETRLALMWMFHTAMRLEETLQMKGSDLVLDDPNPSVWINSKGGDRDYFAIPLIFLEELRKRESFDHIFTFTAATANHSLQRGAKALGITSRIHVHMLRKLRASERVKSRVPIQHVQQLLRHKNIDQTQRTYAHLDNSDVAMTINEPFLRGESGLTTDQLLNLVERAIKLSRVEADPRVNIEKEKGKITILIKETE